jgi:hypothetical protein
MGARVSATAETGQDAGVAEALERTQGPTPEVGARRSVEGVLPDAVLGLQRSVGNRATQAALVRSPAVGGVDSRLARVTARPGDAGPPDQRVLARCDGPCSCGGHCQTDEPLEDEMTRRLQRAVASRRDDSARRVVLAEMPLSTDARSRGVFRAPSAQADGVPTSTDATPTATTNPAPKSGMSDQSHLKPAVSVDEDTAKKYAAAAIRVLGPYGATIVQPPSPLVASNDLTNAPGQQVQTWPAQRMLMRESKFKLEVGFVGALQLCYDLCTGELSVNGWVWVGGGYAGPGLLGGESFYGAYAFYEKEFGKWKLDFMPRLACGTCDPACQRKDSDGDEFAAGITGFPVVIKPGEKAELKQAGIEAGVLLTPHSSCDADLEVIVLIDLTRYLGPVGAAVKTWQDELNRLAKADGLEFDCGVGVAGSGTFHLCKSAPGGGLMGITCDSALLCVGGYVGCAVGVGHDKASLPGGGH